MHLNYLHPFCTNYTNKFTSTVPRYSRVFQQLQAEGRRDAFCAIVITFFEPA